jgi:hypothetical protein
VKRLDPHDWSPDRLYFSAYKLISLFVASRPVVPGERDYDQIVLVGRPGRNSFEAYTLTWIHAVLHAALSLWMLSAAGLHPIAQIIVLPPLVLVAGAVVTIGSCFIGAMFRGATGLKVNSLRLNIVLNTLNHTAVALFLLTRDHWTRHVAAGWFVLLGVNAVAFLFRMLLRRQFTALSERMGRESQFAD